MLVDWLTIKTEYINSNISQRDIAKKYNVSFSTLQVRARKEKWTEERKKQYDEIEASVRQKALDVISKQKIDRVTKLLTISDALVEQLETATQQLNKQMIRNKRKKRTVEYKDSKAMGKPTKEIIEENEELVVVPGIIDRLGLQQISNALKNIKDVQLLSNENTDNEAKPFYLDSMLLADNFQSIRRDILNSNHTEYVFSGGRGSAKSSFVSLEIVELLKNNPDMHVLVCRQVADTLRDSVYAQIKWAIDKLGLNDEFTVKVSPLEITHKKTGQKIYFRGADDPLKIKSIKPNFGYIGILWFEELDQFHGDEAVRSVEQSAIRGGDKAYIFKSFNPPKTSANWANKYIQIPKDTRLVNHSTYLTVPPEWLGKTFLDEAAFLKETNPKAYEHEYLGVPNGTGGQVFENVVLREITDEEINRYEHHYYGLDFGWIDPYAFNGVSYNANARTLYIYEERHGSKTSNEKLAKILEPWKKEIIVCDSAEPKSIGDLRAWDFSARGAVKGPGSLDYSMKWLQSLSQIVIDHKRCPYTAEEFTNYEYERTKDGEVISSYPDGNDHHISAVRYAMERVWSRRGQ